MLWFYLAFLSVVLFAISNIIDKHAITEYIKKPLFHTVISGAINFMAAVFVFFYVGFRFPEAGILVLGLLVGVLLMIANYLFFRGVLSEEVSRVMPVVSSMGPLFVIVIAALFLGEMLSSVQYLGIFLLLVASILVSIKKTTKITLSVAFWILTFSAFVYSIHDTMMKYLLSYISFWEVFFLQGMGMMFTALLIMIFYHKTFISTLNRLRKPSLLASTSEVIGTGGYFVYTVALSVGFVSLVSAVQYSQPLIVLALATLLSIYRPKIIREELKSSVLALKIVAIFIMIAGMFLLV